MIRAARASVKARLAATLTVYDERLEAFGNVLASPFVLVEFPPPLLKTDRLSDSSHQGEGWFQTTSVGESLDQADAVQERVETALDGWSPQIPGQIVSKVRMYSEPRTLPPFDDLPGVVLHQHVTRWEWSAQTA